MVAGSSSKFGTFGGVFTPSILTILGVIMYLRLPWMVGHGGLWASLAIILVAHVVSVATGLSISSIATDKNVGAGGPYYIISRSLGLPIGGTIGLALFLGLAFSISLYVIGFSESFLHYTDLGATPANLRICGTVTLLVLTGVTLISTTLAIRTQYLILTLIAISLFAIFLGSPERIPARPGLPPDVPLGAEALFAVFFPAVTGFTAGVNMSGDLRDPKAAIPVGTLAAIGTGLVVYVSLTVFLALRVPPHLLRDDPQVLEHLAVWAPLVVAGIWGATLSSALGSILGAPRILQAIARDGIAHRWLAAGQGPTREPRNALLLAFLIAEGGILIAELNAIARVVSIVFLSTYGFLNTASATESWVSPDFRPDFRIPRWVSVVGAATCLLLMIRLDPLSMAAATAGMGGLYLFLQRRQLRLESGDAWEGIWSALVRAGLYRLHGTERQQRNWRPNVLMFRGPTPSPGLVRLAESLASGSGLVTDFQPPGAGREGPGRGTPFDEREGLFHRTLAEDGDDLGEVEALCRHYGYAGLEPNTVLFEHAQVLPRAAAFASLMRTLSGLGLNVLIHGAGEGPSMAPHPRIDVWWRFESSPRFGIALARSLSMSPAFRAHRVRFLTVCDDSIRRDGARNATRRLLSASRIPADVDVFLGAVEPKSFESWVSAQSADAALTLVELAPRALTDADLAGLEAVQDAVGEVLWLRPGTPFDRPSLPAPRDSAPGDARPDDTLDDLELPALPHVTDETLRARGESFAFRVEAAVEQLFEGGLDQALGHQRELLAKVGELVDRHYELLLDALEEPQPVRRRRAVNRIQSAYLKEARAAVDAFAESGVVAQRDHLEGPLAALLEDRTLIDAARNPDDDGWVGVERDRDAFAPNEDDPPEVARLKKGHLRRAPREGPVPTEVPVRPLQERALARILRRALEPAFDALTDGGWAFTVSLGRAVSGARNGLALFARRPTDQGPDALRTLAQEQWRLASAALSAVEDDLEATRRAVQRALLLPTRQTLRRHLEELESLAAADRERRRPLNPRTREALAAELTAMPGRFLELEAALLERIRLGLEVAAFQQRLSTIADRTREALDLELRNVLGQLTPLRSTIAELRDDPDRRPPPRRGDRPGRFDPARVLDSLKREGRRSADALPEEVRVLSDESIPSLAEGLDDEVELVDLPLRRLARFLLDAEMIGPVERALGQVPALEARAATTADDAVRMVALAPAGDEQPEPPTEAERAAAFDDSLARLDEAIAALEACRNELDRLLDARLLTVLRGTDPWELTRSARSLGAEIRRHQGQRAVSGAQSLVLRGVSEARRAAVGAVYRQSDGVLLARRLARETTTPSGTIDAIRALVEAYAPSPRVLDDLPLYYRQLFLGKATFDETYWVEREEEQRAARRAVSQHERGARGVLLVTGDPDSGKTALVRHLAARALSGRTVRRVTPPEASTAAVGALERAVVDALGASGNVDGALRSLPRRSVVVVEDLHRWWARRAGGLGAIDRLLALVEAHAERVLFILEAGRPAFDVLARLRPLEELALTVVECGPMSARQLRDVVLARHGSTGMTFELDGRPEGQVGGYRLAAHFTRLFRSSGGLVGVALATWIAQVRRVDERTLVLGPPPREGARSLDDLKSPWVALLVLLLLVGPTRRRDVASLSMLPASEVGAELEALLRTGLVEESGAVVRVSRPITHLLLSRLRALEVLP
ncbi:MAG: hypothetical protein ACFCGT_24690 [Sandaracinaceae bacterium]